MDKDATAGSQLSGMLVDFEDPQGKKFSDSADFSIPIKQANILDELSQYWFLGLIAIAVILFIGMKKMKKKEKA